MLPAVPFIPAKMSAQPEFEYCLNFHTCQVIYKPEGEIVRISELELSATMTLLPESMVN